MIELRQAKDEDIDKLKSLWQECFGDEMEYINLYFDNLYKNEYCYVAVQGQTICSMQMFLPATLKNKKGRNINGRYVYAVATNPDFRGKGIMRKLEEFAKEDVKSKGIEFLTLVPASQSLFNLYKEIGYKNYAYLENVTYDKLKFKQHTKKTDIEEISLNELNDLRAEFLKSFDEYIFINDVEYIKKELEFLKAILLKVTNEYGSGYVLCFKEEEKAYVKECSLNEKMLQSSLEDICKKLNCDKIILKLSQKNLKSINKTPYSMVKWLKCDEDSSLDSTYQNLMLD